MLFGSPPSGGAGIISTAGRDFLLRNAQGSHGSRDPNKLEGTGTKGSQRYKK